MDKRTINPKKTTIDPKNNLLYCVHCLLENRKDVDLFQWHIRYQNAILIDGTTSLNHLCF